MAEIQNVTIFARSPGLDPAQARVIVTVPTFRRPVQIIDTLNSLIGQMAGKDMAIVVMENDAEGMAGAQAARSWFDAGHAEGLVIVAHDRGNCHAYNAGWSVALATFPNATHIAVIDDDELASPHWVARLLDTAGAHEADMVGGPQLPVFENKALEHWAKHPAFTPHYRESRSVPILYSSGNVLISRAVLEVMPHPFLDPAFNFIGGGDSDFYRRAREKGFSFAWCAEAPVMETVPVRRTEFSWLNARSLRNGALSAIIERREKPGLKSRALILAKSLALLAASPFRGLKLLVETGSPVIALYHAQVAIGRLMAEVGLVNEQYRNPEAN